MYFNNHYYVNGLQILMPFPDLRHILVSTAYLLNISVWPNGHSKLLCLKEDSSSVSAINHILLLTHLFYFMLPSYCKSLCIINFSQFLSSHTNLPPSPTNILLFDIFLKFVFSSLSVMLKFLVRS